MTLGEKSFENIVGNLEDADNHPIYLLKTKKRSILLCEDIDNLLVHNVNF